MFGFSGPIIGAFLQKYGARKVITTCATLTGVCYLLLSEMSQIQYLFLAMATIGIGSAGITLIPNQTLISNWFNKYRGRAMGVMMMGIGFGGLLMPQVANYIIEAHGWRTSFRALGALLLVSIIPVTLLLVRTRPSDIGLQPDGVSHDDTDESGAPTEPAAAVGLTVKRSIRTTSFWLLFVAFMLLVFGESGLTINFVAFLDDAGLSSQRSAFFWGMAAGISAAGRLGFGFLADRWNPRILIALTHGFHAVAVAILLVMFLGMGIHSGVSLFPFSLIYGVSLGGSAVLLPVMVGRCFGLAHFSKVLGILMSGFALGVVGGPLLAGGLFDKTGSYRLALIIFAVGFAIAAVAVALINPDKYRDEFTSE
jgi:MFS family permease